MLIIKSNQGMQAPLVSLANLFQTMLFSSLLRWCSKILLAVAVLAVIVSADTPCCAAGCGDKGALKYWALDTPNNECAETCLDPNTPFWPLLRAEWATLTGFKGKKATTPHPCASSGFSKYNRTDTLGKGPLRIVLDKYRPDGPLPLTNDDFTKRQSFVVADMHDGDQKTITFGVVGHDLRVPMTIEPHGNNQTWKVETILTITPASITATVDFNVPGKPNPPPISLQVGIWTESAGTMGQGDKKRLLEFTDPSGKLAKPGFPLNTWIEIFPR